MQQVKKTSPKNEVKACPMRELLSRFGDKWTVLVIIHLSDSPRRRRRFSDLKKSIEGISQRMLTLTLRNLQRDGLISRYVYPEIPPRVEYELTSLGESVLAPMEGLVQWIELHWSKIESSRKLFDGKIKHD